MKSLGEALPEEIKRVSVIRYNALEIGAHLLFLSTMTKASIENATQALASGDVIAMTRAYEDLKEYSE